jgi:hypothetical protein
MRVALLVDSEQVDYHTFKLFQELKASEKVDVVSIVRQSHEEKPSAKRKGFFGRVLEMLKTQGLGYLPYAIAYKFVITVERSRYRKLVGENSFNALFSKHDLGKEAVTTIDVHPIKSKNGLFYRFSETDIEKIKQQKIDALIRCGGGIHKGDILTCTKFGIISFHHGDNRKYRGGPAGFWEVLDGEEYTGFIIQKLTEDLDGGEVIMRGEFSTQNYFLANQTELWRKSTSFLVRTLEKIAELDDLPAAEECRPYSRRLYKYPKVSDLLAYIFAVYARIVSNKVLSLRRRFHKENYFLLYTKLDNWKNLNFRQLKVLKPRTGRFFADPFVISHNDDKFAFFEDYCMSSQKGEVSCMKLVEGELAEYATVLTSEHHLSFPYVFEHQDQKFMVPECIGSNSVSLYQAAEFPLKWKKVDDLLPNTRAADPMVVSRNGKFWLFCNIDTNGEDDFSRELHIFHSDDLIDGEWKPHRNNPFVNSPRGGRNGGVIVDEGQIYRVGQVSTLDTYGKSFLIYKIVELSEQNYREELVYEPNGLHDERIRLTHHLSAIPGLAIMDGFGRW